MKELTNINKKKELIIKSKDKKQTEMLSVIEFYDNEDAYARIETAHRNIPAIEKELRKYKSRLFKHPDKLYEINDFLNKLKKKKIKFKIHSPPDYYLYF